MSFGTRFRTKPGATSSLKATAGAMLIGAALVGGSLGAAVAQDATPPSASPEASPVAVAAWIDEIMVDDIDATEVDSDSSTVGVVIDDEGSAPLVINSASFETRPYVILQTVNNNDADDVVVLLNAPAEFDATGFMLPSDAADLPEGVTPFQAYEVAAGETVGAVFPDLAPGTYVLATTSGSAVSFVVNEMAEVEVPDLFASPEATP